MRDYDLMRNILLTVSLSSKPLNLVDFADLAKLNKIKEELARLKEEGLINSTFVYDAAISHGEVQGLTKEGRAFLRNIENEEIWLLLQRTPNAANLDISYPLLNEICEVIIKKYVISKIPKDIE